MKKLHIAVLVLALAFGLCACGGEKVEAPSPAPVETASPTATPTASPEATATPTPTPSPTAEPTPEATAEPTPTAKATPAPTPKASKAPATAAPTPEPAQNAAAETDRPDGWVDETPNTPPPEVMNEVQNQNVGSSDADADFLNREMERQAGKVSMENVEASDLNEEECKAMGIQIAG